MQRTTDMPKRRDSPQPSRSPIVMVWSFMVPKPAATPAILENPGCVESPAMVWRQAKRRQMRLGQTVEIMAAGFGIRTGRHHITGCEKLARQPARLFHGSAQ